ncbi:hypothetical protein [Rhodococcus sp. ACT016]|uniref:hypothetical protein n=1 Tax=Rhodococcus sp. ACT016 TaxID=3134808 RepID=UPI003D299B73
MHRACVLDADAHRAMARAGNPYRDGRVATRAVAGITELVGAGSRLPDFVGGSSLAPAS